MPRWLIGGLLLATVTLGTRTTADDDPDWEHDLTRAKAAARATGKPIFLVFRCER
jgi:hypothetical protein